MKKLRVIMFAALAFSCLTAFQPLQGHGDTVTMKFEGVGGANSGGVYTYPYYFSIDGSPTQTALMCYIYQNEIQVGETWTANVAPISVGSTSQAIEEEELAWLYNQASTTPGDASLAQWSAWKLFDSSLSITGKNGEPSATDVTNELDQALSFADDPANAGFYSNFQLYIPVLNSQDPLSDGTPQSFIGISPVPEPESMLLLGTGLLALAGLIFRKRLAASQDDLAADVTAGAL